MPRTSPLLADHDAAGAIIVPYGPEGADNGIPLVQVYSGIDREYAAIRKSAAILDFPHRTILEVTGSDRLSFLNRMVTQELKGLLTAPGPPFTVRRSFWLNRKGRIDSDITIIAGADSLLLELDAHAAQRTFDGLSAFIIADDVQLVDQSHRLHRLDLHGPDSAALLARISAPLTGAPPITDLLIDHAATYQSHDAPVVIWRHDSTGGPAFSLACPRDSASAMYALLAESADSIDRDRARPDRGFDRKARGESALAIRAGWHAWNIARIEAGTAVYNLDFGPTSLPHETGDETLKDRVSFTKGCYLGQEVVARMNALGHPKQKLVALDLQATTTAPQPVTGSLLFANDDPVQPPVGAVTSSAAAPMLGGRSACFAMVKYACSNARTPLFLQPTPDQPLSPALVRESLTYWSRPLPGPTSL